MLYWTARADENGNVEFSPDRYHRDPPLIAALGFHPGSPAIGQAKPQVPAGKPKPNPGATRSLSCRSRFSLHMPEGAPPSD